MLQATLHSELLKLVIALHAPTPYKHHTCYVLMFNLTNKESQLSHIDTLLGMGWGDGKNLPS
jgi:hypothetical protein